MRNKILVLATCTGNKPSTDYAQKMGRKTKTAVKNIKTVFTITIIRKRS
jgi:hypothetical protein